MLWWKTKIPVFCFLRKLVFAIWQMAKTQKLNSLFRHECNRYPNFQLKVNTGFLTYNTTTQLPSPSKNSVSCCCLQVKQLLWESQASFLLFRKGNGMQGAATCISFSKGDHSRSQDTNLKLYCERTGWKPSCWVGLQSVTKTRSSSQLKECKLLCMGLKESQLENPLTCLLEAKRKSPASSKPAEH